MSDTQTEATTISSSLNGAKDRPALVTCPVCQHPRRTDIDRLMVDWDDAPQRHRPERGEFLDKLWARFHHYTDDSFTRQTLLTHFQEHDRLISLPPIEVDRERGVVRRGDALIAIPEIPEALDTIIALGIDHLSQRPDLIKPHHVIAALKLKAQLQPHSLHQDEFIVRIFEILRSKEPAEWAKEAPLYRELQRLSAPPAMDKDEES